jgi:hypothetical protein
MVFSQTRTRFVVLPPCGLRVSRQFRNIQFDTQRYDEFIADMQRFRGEVYLGDGAIQTSDLVNGRHRLSIDEHSWHVLSLDSSGRIIACLRYLAHLNARSFDDLWVRDAALAACPKFGGYFRRAVEAEILHARQMKLGFGEVGGWAVAKAYRRTLEPLRVILTSYALGQLLGGCTGVATATFRHGSADVLRRIGLNPLQWDGAALPPYYDQRYGCQMEVLRFDTRSPNAKYQEAVTKLSAALAGSPVVCYDAIETNCEGVCAGQERGVPAIPSIPGFMVPGLMVPGLMAPGLIAAVVPTGQPATAWS